MVPPEQVAELADALPCPLLVDEAYVDFADTNCLSLVAENEKIMVARTLSKSYALAGLRFGYLVAQPQVIRELRKVKDSYNCDALSIAGATAAIDDQAWLDGNARRDPRDARADDRRARASSALPACRFASELRLVPARERAGRAALSAAQASRRAGALHEVPRLGRRPANHRRHRRASRCLLGAAEIDAVTMRGRGSPSLPSDLARQPPATLAMQPAALRPGNFALLRKLFHRRSVFCRRARATADSIHTVVTTGLRGKSGATDPAVTTESTSCGWTFPRSPAARRTQTQGVLRRARTLLTIRLLDRRCAGARGSRSWLCGVSRAEEPITFVLPAANFQPVAGRRLSDEPHADAIPPDAEHRSHRRRQPADRSRRTTVSPEAHRHRIVHAGRDVRAARLPELQRRSRRLQRPAAGPLAQRPVPRRLDVGLRRLAVCERPRHVRRLESRLPIWHVTVDGMVMTRENADLGAVAGDRM